ncbi:MAG: nuclear transport factor 2 family protein [Haloechinothrix sp.]
MSAELVRRFYDEIWNGRDLNAIAAIVHADMTFRGSLGVERRGREEFTRYVEEVTSALGTRAALMLGLPQTFGHAAEGGRSSLIGRQRLPSWRSTVTSSSANWPGARHRRNGGRVGSRGDHRRPRQRR